jgi:imidazolonepropionase-like amidohydrolase
LPPVEPQRRLCCNSALVKLAINSGTGVNMRRSISLVALSLAGAAAAQTPPAAPLTALQCGHLIDTAEGKMLGATTVVVEGGHIRELASGATAPAGAKVVDLSTQTCMPGLIDTPRI